MDRIRKILSQLNGDNQISVYRVNSKLDIEMTNTSVDSFIGMITNGYMDPSQIVEIKCDKNVIFSV